jgi:hypothetical protein
MSTRFHEPTRKKASQWEPLKQIQAAMANGTAPQGPQTDHISDVIYSFQNYEQTYLGTDGNFGSRASKARIALQNQFEAWGQAYIAQHPDVADLWNLLIVPEMGTKALTQGVVGA